ncbi:MAG: 2-hydroxyacyl-CoA dehydratase [Acutalibacteraceae bacterium]|nr:2-hydroxyacyl-CoA dehydratase [Acutalibacteraceae bacterium]
MNTADRVEFTKDMMDYTILAPNMLDVHFSLFLNIFGQYGYKVELLKNDGRAVVDEGLKYVHNDTCYPALLVIGQLIDALNSGKYNPDKTALLITQSGGGCRASNYIHLLRKALKKAGYPQVPVISLNLSGLEKNSGFKIRLSMALKMLSAVIYADLITLLKNQVEPYEKNKGQSAELVQKWVDDLSAELKKGRGYSFREIKKNLPKITKTFAEIPVNDVKKIKVGVVGEIYVKYSPLANNHLEEFLAEQDCEVMVPGLLGFLNFKVDNRLEDIKLYGGNPFKKIAMQFAMWYLSKVEKNLNDAAAAYGNFVVPEPYAHIKEKCTKIIGAGCKMGEGWLLTAEMMELIESGYGNIVCAQPFGCLPNHIVGKGMIRKLKEMYPQSNIVPIDYDPGATRVNQENRIKLMLAIAKENEGITQ